MPLRDYVPEPSIILMGCQAWPPKQDGPDCPVCGGAIRQDGHYCAACDALSPRREAQVKAALVGIKGKSKAEVAEARARQRLQKHHVVLTQAERRRLWNGYRGGILAECTELTNRALTGREFLTRIGQEPDWDLILDRRGTVVGHMPPEAVA